MELACQSWPAEKREIAKIVLLHGMGGTGSLWRPIAASLEDDFSLLAPDQRGHGRSQLPRTPGSRIEIKYTPLDYGNDLAETLGALDFHPAWVVGHSMGVRSALAVAHLRPEWVCGMILVDLGFYGEAGGGLGQGLAKFLRLLPQRFGSREEARAFMNANCPDPAIAQYLMAVAISDADGGVRFPFDHSALIQTIEAAKNVSVREWVRELGSKGMRILVLRGERSLVWTHQEYEEERARFKDLSSIVFKEIPEAGHGLPFEQRAKFVEEIRSWIGQ